MDNLCHTLAGAAIAQAGFAKRAPRATLLAVIGANIPDVDAFVYFVGNSATAVAFRRGVTHGIVALVIWPLLLAGIFWWWHRRRPAKGIDQAAFGITLAAAAAAVWSHPALDWLNTYGVRFLMPFSNTWFYGDTLFIVDLVLLGLFGVGWWMSRRRLRAGVAHAARPAQIALATAVVYIGLMKTASEVSRAAVLDTLGRERAGRREVMVAPRAASIREREALVRTAQGTYESYEVRWNGASAQVSGPLWSLPSRTDATEANRASDAPDGRKFLRWSRFPYFVPAPDGDSSVVFLGDVRYASGTEESWAGIRIPIR